MNEEQTAQALTKHDFMQAVAQAGGPKAVQAAFDGLRLANDQLDKEYSRILKEYPWHWIAIGPDGMIATVPVPEDAPEEDQQKAFVRLFELIRQSKSNKTGYLVRYINPQGEVLIL